MNWIPKLLYTPLAGGGEVTITFDSQPEQDPLGEEIIGNRKVTRSSDGTSQTQWNYNMQKYKLTFLYQSDTVKNALDTFFKNEAFKGNTFKWYPSSDESDFETFRFIGGSFKPFRAIPDGSGDFEYNFDFEIERVL